MGVKYKPVKFLRISSSTLLLSIHILVISVGEAPDGNCLSSKGVNLIALSNEIFSVLSDSDS